MHDVIVTTMNDLPGYEVVEVHGGIFGLDVRARNAFSHVGVEVRSVVGGESRGFERILADSRSHAVERLKEAARDEGANAVLAMRFDCVEIAEVLSEVAAYGTAVSVRRL